MILIKGSSTVFHNNLAWAETNQNKKLILDFSDWDWKESFDGILYVHAKEGVGDQIHHASMLTDLHKIHPHIYVIVDSRLVSLFKRSFPKINFIGDKENFPYSSNDYHILFEDLQQHLRPSAYSFKEEPTPYLIPNEDLIKKYSKISTEGIKIGLSWWSNRKSNSARIIPLEKLSKIIFIPEHDIINLQYEKPLPSLVENIDLKNDFEGVAALACSCDIILTIDNWIAHLAGALGLKTCVMLNENPFWYWMPKDKDCLWYSNVKLFRQTKAGDWDDVIDNVLKEVQCI